MQYALSNNDCIYIYGTEINELSNYFIQPFSSHHINVYVSDGKTGDSTLYTMSNVKSKMVCLQNSAKEFVFIPLLHTLDILN